MHERVKETEKLQNKAVRIMCFKAKSEPAKPLYRELKILKIRSLIQHLIIFNLCYHIGLEIYLSILMNTSKKWEIGTTFTLGLARGSKEKMFLKARILES